MSEILLQAKGLSRHYPGDGAPVRAVDTVDLALETGEAVSVVGPSGCGKSALRGVRRSTVRALEAQVRPPRRSSRAARLAAWAGMPLPAVLGMRSAVRRPARTIANAAGLALGVAMVIVGLGAYQGTRDFPDSPVRDEEEALSRTVNAILIDEVLAIVFFGAGLLVALAALNAMIVAAFAARDSSRNHAILRVLGATPRQTFASFVVAQLGASLLGCATGIPLGILLFNSTVVGSAKDLKTIALPASVYVLVAVAVPLLYLMIVAGPATRRARRPVAGALTYE